MISLPQIEQSPTIDPRQLRYSTQQHPQPMQSFQNSMQQSHRPFRQPEQYMQQIPHNPQQTQQRMPQYMQRQAYNRQHPHFAQQQPSYPMQQPNHDMYQAYLTAQQRGLTMQQYQQYMAQHNFHPQQLAQAGQYYDQGAQSTIHNHYTQVSAQFAQPWNHHSQPLAQGNPGFVINNPGNGSVNPVPFTQNPNPIVPVQGSVESGPFPHPYLNQPQFRPAPSDTNTTTSPFRSAQNLGPPIGLPPAAFLRDPRRAPGSHLHEVIDLTNEDEVALPHIDLTFDDLEIDETISIEETTPKPSQGPITEEASRFRDYNALSAKAAHVVTTKWKKAIEEAELYAEALGKSSELYLKELKAQFTTKVAEPESSAQERLDQITGPSQSAKKRKRDAKNTSQPQKEPAKRRKQAPKQSTENSETIENFPLSEAESPVSEAESSGLLVDLDEPTQTSDDLVMVESPCTSSDSVRAGKRKAVDTPEPASKPVKRGKRTSKQLAGDKQPRKKASKKPIPEDRPLTQPITPEQPKPAELDELQAELDATIDRNLSLEVVSAPLPFAAEETVHMSMIDSTESEIEALEDSDSRELDKAVGKGSEIVVNENKDETHTINDADIDDSLDSETLDESWQSLSVAENPLQTVAEDLIRVVGEESEIVMKENQDETHILSDADIDDLFDNSTLDESWLSLSAANKLLETVAENVDIGATQSTAIENPPIYCHTPALIPSTPPTVPTDVELDISDDSEETEPSDEELYDEETLIKIRLLEEKINQTSREAEAKKNNIIKKKMITRTKKLQAELEELRASSRKQSFCLEE